MRRILASLIVSMVAAPHGLALDLHAFWDSRCGGCHGHAGDFARRYLKVEDGKLAGRHHKDNLRLFLGQHEMRDGAVADGIYGMLLAQASATPLYQQKCRTCHQNAADLARTSLIMADGKIAGRTSGQALGDFLPRHVPLQPDEIASISEALSRVYREVHGP